MEIEIKKNELVVLAEADIYSEDVLHKCFYWYTGDYRVQISRYSQSLLSVRLQPLPGEGDLKKLIEKIKRDLIDYKLRDVVTKETKTIRELIVAKAFAYSGLEEGPLPVTPETIGYGPQVARIDDGPAPNK